MKRYVIKSKSDGLYLWNLQITPLPDSSGYITPMGIPKKESRHDLQKEVFGERNRESAGL